MLFCRISSGSVVCITPPALTGAPTAGPVTMQFDKQTVEFHVEPFRYITNPTVSHVVSEKGIVRYETFPLLRQLHY